MGARGPAPQPTALKLLRGNPGHQKLNRQEPKPRPVAPKCPDWLDLIGKREWRRIVPELDRLGLLTTVDMAALASYCTLYSTIVQCERVIQAEGFTALVGEKGYLQQRPEVAIRQKAILAIKAFCAEFGLTPSSRGRMTVPEKDDDEGADLLD